MGGQLAKLGNAARAKARANVAAEVGAYGSGIDELVEDGARNIEVLVDGASAKLDF
jgi:hypothetical protein